MPSNDLCLILISSPSRHAMNCVILVYPVIIAGNWNILARKFLRESKSHLVVLAHLQCFIEWSYFVKAGSLEYDQRTIHEVFDNQIVENATSVFNFFDLSIS
jgi:hypothetical protein